MMIFQVGSVLQAQIESGNICHQNDLSQEDITQLKVSLS